MSTANIITGYGSNWSPGLSTTDRLKTFCDFLHVEDPDTHRYFKDECDDIEIFLSNLASSKEMFDVGVYEQVKSMLRVHRERMLEREGDRLMRPLTFKVPSGSTTQSSNEYSIISLDEWRRPSDETEATDRDLDYGDGDTLEFFHTDHERRKRPRTEANESGQKNQGSRRAARQKDKRTAAENDLFTGINCLGEYEYASRGELEPAYEVGWADGERRGSVDRDGELIGGIPKPGSGSLVPPEVAALRADDDRESVGSAEGEEENLDERFYPGDPVFMFGETIFLQALQSRQIENDMAPGGLLQSGNGSRSLH